MVDTSPILFDIGTDEMEWASTDQQHHEAIILPTQHPEYGYDQKASNTTQPTQEDYHQRGQTSTHTTLIDPTPPPPYSYHDNQSSPMNMETYIDPVHDPGYGYDQGNASTTNSSTTVVRQFVLLLFYILTMFDIERSVKAEFWIFDKTIRIYLQIWKSIMDWLRKLNAVTVQ